MSYDLDINNKTNEITFSSVFSNISYAEKIIKKISEQTDITEFLYGNILLSLSEAINNAIVHGNKFDPDKVVSVSYAFNEKALMIEVRDQGEGFDPNQVSDPTLPENIENLYGRGVYIIISLSDKVEFEYKDGQIVRMFFNLN